VTGGAAGIGLALGRAFAQSGMKVMLADIETDALQAAVKSLQEISPTSAAPSAMWPTRKASSARRRLVRGLRAWHVVCNNAGVAAGRRYRPHLVDNWRWVIDVNLLGVRHGIKSFCPHIRAHGEAAHIVNHCVDGGHGRRTGF
jgi:NADP-dependent 3-hydroxy acid dehydrogenase YdfG